MPSDPITSWRFDWGDDSPSTGKMATRPVDYGHTFAGGNLSFNVTYSITDSAGCGPYGVTLPVNLNQPKADFTLGSPYGCPGAPITLANASKDIGNNPQPFSQVNWTFSDGTTATGETPYKAFSAAGAYDITLNVTDAIGCTASITKTQAVTVHDPKAIFSLPDISNTCPPVLNFHSRVPVVELMACRDDSADPMYSVPSAPIAGEDWMKLPLAYADHFAVAVAGPT